MPSTTELFVEHVISGILSLVWIFAIAFTITGLEYKIFLEIDKYLGIISILIISIAYPIGMFVDTIADKILEKRERKLKNAHISALRVLYTMQDSSVNSYFAYNRFRRRVSRSSLINFLLIAIFVPLYFILRSELLASQVGKYSVLSLFIVGMFLSVCSYLVWVQTIKSINKRLLQIEKENPDKFT